MFFKNVLFERKLKSFSVGGSANGKLSSENRTKIGPKILDK